jgi:hypothetical protein
MLSANSSGNPAQRIVTLRCKSVVLPCRDLLVQATHKWFGTAGDKDQGRCHLYDNGDRTICLAIEFGKSIKREKPGLKRRPRNATSLTRHSSAFSLQSLVERLFVKHVVAKDGLCKARCHTCFPDAHFIGHSNNINLLQQPSFSHTQICSEEFEPQCRSL